MGLAEKYGLLELKAACEAELSLRICKENVCQLVALADLYCANSLKEVRSIDESSRHGYLKP